ncbi:MAG: EcsC family protein [Acidobacteriota bacterium]|nr:EcsC family protein [Acidobacteriota bacterium]
MTLSEHDRDALAAARDLLEHPGLPARLAGLIGMPVDKAMGLLPERWSEAIGLATHKSLDTALQVALTTLDDAPRGRSREGWHKLAVAATGAGGGALGLVGLPVELPVSTTIMLRSIADIARSEGEALGSPDARMACLEVFALGGRTSADDASESSYFLVRAALARSISEAATYVTQRGVAEKGAPALVRLIAQLASRFGTTVSQKVAAQAVPIVGAAGGVAINLLFMDHFQDMARGHFTVRRLERAYSPAFIKEAYEQLP